MVSIVVPVYNDSDGIQTTLDSLVSQSYDDYAISAIDNNSTDNSAKVIKSIASAHPNRIQYSKENHVQSSYAARNTGIKHTTGEILLFLDANMWVPKTWIGDMVKSLESNDYDYLGCNVDIVTADLPNICERYEQAFSFPVETYLKDKHFAPTCALAVRREVFEEVGLFDERLESGGDEEFGQRVHRAGFKQGYAENITAYHPARDSWDALYSKALRIGRGQAQKNKYYSDTSHPLHPINFLPPSPFRLRRRFSGKDVSIQSLAGFYLLEYVLKITQTYGAIREMITQHYPEQESHT